MTRHTLWSLLLVAGFTAPWLVAQSSNPAPDDRARQGHHETLNQPYVPAPREGLSRSPAVRFEVDGITTVQVNVDYGSEADAMQKLRVGMGTSSLLTAMFANFAGIDYDADDDAGQKLDAFARWIEDRAAGEQRRHLGAEHARAVQHIQWLADVGGG